MMIFEKNMVEFSLAHIIPTDTAGIMATVIKLGCSFTNMDFGCGIEAKFFPFLGVTLETNVLLKQMYLFLFDSLL